MKKVIVLICLIAGCNKLLAQYTNNGSAVTTNCHCYILTPASMNTNGSVWNNNKIDLRISFDFQFNVFLGCSDASGADGIVFALQPLSTSVGSAGGGLGFDGVVPSIGVTLDTYQNTGNNDPYYDHIDFQYNGNLNHIGTPPAISATSDNVEDCNWHTLRITWDAPSTTYTAYFDGILRITTVNDLVTTTFKGDPMVFWGFTGSTGGSSNLQQFCTALTPAYKQLSNQKRCIGEPITFYDSTISFAPLFKRYWDFGDNSPVDSVNINPTHRFAIAGDYTVKQTVIGKDGCLEINSQVVRIGSKPVAAFSLNNACADSTVSFKDASLTQVGTVNQWNWDLGAGIVSTQQNPTHAYPMYEGGGPLTIKLSVKTLEGCTSDTVTSTLKIFPRPTANFTNVPAACFNTTVSFNDSSHLDQSGNTFNSIINNWLWNFGNGQASTSQNNSINFTTTGINTISLTVKTDSGCSSLPIAKTINILPKPTAAFTTGAICETAITNFTDASTANNGDAIKSWWWNLGDGTIAATQNTSTTYNVGANVTIQMVVSDINNCLSDTLKKIINIGKKPVANFSTASVLCDNANIQFTDLSSTATGTIQDWAWQFDNGTTSTVQNSSTIFNAGNHTVQLAVSNNAGCTSATATQRIFVNPLPAVGFSFAAACKNAIVNFTGIDNSGGTINHWTWDLSDGATANSQNTTHTYNASATYPIKLLVTSTAGCSAIKDSSLIIYGTEVFAGNDTIAAPNQPIQLQATGGLTYQWSPSFGLSNPTISNPIATNDGDQTYLLTASTPLGCQTYDRITIKVIAGPQLYLPTAFSPNGDGLNDVFKVIPVGIATFDYFTVYNRYGKIIFFTKKEGQGWDGTVKGNPQAAGTYVWIVAGTDYKGNKIVRKGTVLLVR